MNALLDRIYESGEVEGPGGERVACFPTSVPRDTARALHALVKAARPVRTLEVGLAYGLSALAICQALEDNGQGHHTAIDPMQHGRWKSIGLENLNRAGLDGRLEFLEERSHRALPRLEAEGRRFDFAFIDGWHLFDYALVDFFHVDRMLEVGGYVVLDDLWMPSMRKVVSYISRNRPYERVGIPSNRVPVGLAIGRVGRRILTDPFGGGWGVKLMPSNIVALRKTAEDSRHWTFHRGF